MPAKALRLLALLALCAAAPLRAYVTSAILEYSVDDKVGFFLNGSPILAKSDYAAFDFDVLSTSDGTLPMSLFDPYKENELGVEDFDTAGDHISVSYRFTVHISDGDPIVIWSTPDQAKMLHLSKSQPDPEGWTRPDFDDSSWSPAIRGTEISFPFFVFPSLPDPAFGSILGLDAYVPRLSHNFNLKTDTEDHDLYRSHFRFPNHQAKVQTVINPPAGNSGQNIAVRLIPGPDSPDFTQFNMLAWLPKGLELKSAAPGYKYDPNLRRISWSFDRRNLQVGYSRMPAIGVMDSGGWSQPEKALGPYKPGKPKIALVVTDPFAFNDGAKFTAQHPAWFKMAPHGVDLSRVRPRILGVLFKAQMRLGNKDTATTTDADNIMFNYSVDGTEHEALKHDVLFSHMTSMDNWFNAYYDATEDRKWTWEDIQGLAVKIEARARGTVSTDMMSSIVCTVKYYVPAGASPWFYATVTDPRCETLSLNTALFRPGSPLLNSDPVDIPINQGLCQPTPIPTPTETPVPIVVAVIPTPTPVGPMPGTEYFRMGNFTANPEPFNFAGTFIGFSIKHDADVALNVYDVDTGKAVRQIAATAFRAGDNNQIFYNAMDYQGHQLKPGAYLFELVATKGPYKEVINATFHYTRERRSE